MFGSKLRRLREQLSAWLMHRDLCSLARRNSFDSVRPENVLKTLQQLAQFQADGIGADDTIHYRSVLFRIWELAESETKGGSNSRFVWNRVMATCNALYGLKESYSKSNGGFDQEAVGQY